MRGSVDAHGFLAAKRELLSRALRELVALLASAHKQGWALVALECSLEPMRPAGEPRAHLLATFAPCERRLLSEPDAGRAGAHPPAGHPAGPAPEHAPVRAQRIRRERAAGKSLTAIADGLKADRIPTAQGGRRWYPATVRYTLNRTR